jgi:hypothetical protein
MESRATAPNTPPPTASPIFLLRSTAEGYDRLGHFAKLGFERYFERSMVAARQVQC